MAVTRLKRKALKNKLKAKQRNFLLKHLLSKPVIKNITEKGDEIKKSDIDNI